MAVNVPTYFLDEIRNEIIDSTSYTDNELYTYIRNEVKICSMLLQVDHTVIDSTSFVYDFTITNTPINDYWEVLKWGTIAHVLDDYYKSMITGGMGISISLGTEKIDTKSIFIGVKELTNDAKKTWKQKALVYNMLHKAGHSVDLYDTDRFYN